METVRFDQWRKEIEKFLSEDFKVHRKKQTAKGANKNARSNVFAFLGCIVLVYVEMCSLLVRIFIGICGPRQVIVIPVVTGILGGVSLPSVLYIWLFCHNCHVGSSLFPRISHDLTD